MNELMNYTQEADFCREEFKTPIEIALGIDENGMTTARKLYEFLELRKADFARWCRTNIAENEFAAENEDYVRFLFDAETPTGGKIQREDFKLTAHFAKKLSCKGNGERAEQAREYFTKIEEKAKKLTIDRSQLSPQMQMVISMAESMARQELEQNRQAEEIEKVKNTIKQLEAKSITRNEDYFTVAGYASLRGINVDISKASMLGRKASKLSKSYNYDVGTVQDPRFGKVNTYHVDILKEVFRNIA